MTQQFQQDRELGWDDTIVQDSEGGIVLAPGDYIFEVVKFERARYTPKSGDSKLPACNMAKLELKIESPQGTATVFNNLYLHTSTEGLLSAFFASIGQKKKGEPLQMNWNLVTGAKGAVKIKNRTYKDNTYKLIIEEHAEKDSDGKPVTNDDGTYKLTAEGNKEAGKAITELFEEEAVIQYGEYTSKLNDLEKFLNEYDSDVSGDDAQGFFALVTAFENKEDK